MRLFIAINFNSETRKRLTSLREQLRSRSTSGNFTLDDNLHLIPIRNKNHLKNQDKTLNKWVLAQIF